MRFLSVLVLALTATTQAHMNMWHPSMYGWVEHKDQPSVWVPPMLNLTLDQWWFRGFADLSLPTAIMSLPAGGKITVEIACHIAWTSYSPSVKTTTIPGSKLDACPGNPGAFHAGDPQSKDIDLTMLSGCALGIADVDDIHKVTQDNMVIFSTNQSCVANKLTDFHIPALMPSCSGRKCICAWFWLANNGTGNYYMSGFDCSVTNASPQSQLIGTPRTANYTDGSQACKVKPGPPVTGPKKPFFLYNQGIAPQNKVPYLGNYCRSGYHSSWSFNINGAQSDIFTGELARRPPVSSADLEATSARQARLAKRQHLQERNAQAEVAAAMTEVAGMIDATENNNVATRQLDKNYLRDDVDHLGVRPHGVGVVAAVNLDQPIAVAARSFQEGSAAHRLQRSVRRALHAIR